MFILGKENSIVNQFISELRNINVQSDSMRFRRNMERIGEIMAYEISKTLSYQSTEVTTPLGKLSIPLLKEEPVLVTILRAGLPFYQGFLNIFDKADNAFIGAYRNPHTNDEGFDIKMDYVAAPSIEGKVVILIDPMLATGKSLLLSYKGLLKYGKPAKVHVAAVIASQQGLDYLKDNIENVSLWSGAIDQDLNNKAYIIPGLGDAGDLAYGLKM